MQAQSIKWNTKHHYSSQLAQRNMLCVGKNLFSTLLYIVKISTLVNFIVETKSQMKVCCPYANLDKPCIDYSKGTMQEKSSMFPHHIEICN
jgi:hypothetical protein